MLKRTGTSRQLLIVPLCLFARALMRALLEIRFCGRKISTFSSGSVRDYPRNGPVLEYHWYWRLGCNMRMAVTTGGGGLGGVGGPSSSFYRSPADSILFLILDIYIYFVCLVKQAVREASGTNGEKIRIENNLTS